MYSMVSMALSWPMGKQDLERLIQFSGVGHH